MLSPHVYGPMVTSAPTAWAGPDLFARLTASFGYATQQGPQVPCHFSLAACCLQPMCSSRCRQEGPAWMGAIFVAGVAGVGVSGRRFPVAVGEFGSFFSAVLSPFYKNADHHSPQPQSAQHGSVALTSHSNCMVAVQVTAMHDGSVESWSHV